jgi:hypothetical protein
VTPVWLRAPSRFAGWSRDRARAVLGIVVALMALCLLSPDLRTPDPSAAPAPTIEIAESDLGLYDAIVARMRHGDTYYRAATQEMRARPGYPLRPFITVRPPLLAEVQATLPRFIAQALLYLLIVAVALAWVVRVTEAFPDGAARIVAALLLGGGLFTAIQPFLFPSHELWAALLIALSLGVRRPGRWIEAVALALAAMLVRELAALYVVVMLAFAWSEGERREAVGWGVALAVFAAALGAHAWGVAQVTGPLDLASDGWTGLNGVWFFVQTVRHATVLEAFPYLVAIPLVILSLLGWASWRDPVAGRAFATFTGYGLLIALAARLNNFYWGLMVAPVFLLGLAFAPDGVRDLWRAAVGQRRKITVTRVSR